MPLAVAPSVHRGFGSEREAPPENAPEEEIRFLDMVHLLLVSFLKFFPVLFL